MQDLDRFLRIDCHILQGHPKVSPFARAAGIEDSVLRQETNSPNL